MFGELLRLLSMRRVLEMSPTAVEELQSRKLRVILAHAFGRVPFYRERFRSAGLDPSDIRTPADLHLLPETTKQDLQTAGIRHLLADNVDPETSMVICNERSPDQGRGYLARELGIVN